MTNSIEAVKRLVEPWFLIIAGGDGNDQKLVQGYEPAARAAFKMLVHGEPEDDDNNDYDVAIYNAVKDPNSEEWNDAGLQGIIFDFEDGFLQVVRLHTAVSSQVLQDLEELEQLRQVIKIARQNTDKIKIIDVGATHGMAVRKCIEEAFETLKLKEISHE